MSAEAEMDGDREATPVERAQVLGWIAAFVLGAMLLGHLVAVPLFVALIMRFYGERLWLSAAVAAGVGAFVYLCLVRVVHVNLPVPLVRAWLG